MFIHAGLDSGAKENYRPSFMDHFDRIFEGGGRGNGVSAVKTSEEESVVHLRSHADSPFRIKKSGPPDFTFVSL